MKSVFIVPGDPAQRTGGYLYDARIVAELRRLGWTVDVVGLDGQFPLACDTARRALDQCLAGLPDGAVAVIDGLALGGLPDVAVAHGRRLELIALVHHPLADETGLAPAQVRQLLDSERRALAACRRIIVTSRFTARRLAELELAGTASKVVEPGVDAAEPAPAALAMARGQTLPGPMGLVCVASLTPRKGHATLLQALAQLSRSDWTLALVGSETRDRAHAEKLRQLAESSGLGERIHWLGELDEDQLDRAYRSGSLCVVPSLYEGYGMVVSEALARGLPLVSTTGGALADTVPADCALKVAPGDADALAAAIARFMDDAGLRADLCRAALDKREQLPDWAAAGRAFAGAVRP
ncbi:MAG: glycosyltransferase [Wenzhouxiangella sp.]|nr:MAG: glycosyltransferase [Wenzhouxiangella sp.]